MWLQTSLAEAGNHAMPGRQYFWCRSAGIIQFVQNMVHTDLNSNFELKKLIKCTFPMQTDFLLKAKNDFQIELTKSSR